ncbi:MAG: RNA 2',3'-cyclic phosphodiesterase [Balneolaceae bacterium]|nr:RNA 2',3'-cyclic phosphodiesterase [Balneolaceae bacterium]
MRLFTAIDLPDTVKDRLNEIQDPGLGIRWTAPEAMHLTLRFIGDVDSETRDDLIARMSELERSSFSFTIRDIGYFPPRKHPNIVWVGIEESNPLMELQSRIESACRRAGLEPDERPFTPHITIGRVKGARKNEVLSFINNHKKLRIEEIPVEEFILYESTLKPDGAVHTPLRRFSLKQPANQSGTEQ